MNDVVTYQEMIDQPLPSQFEEGAETGGCQAGGGIIIVVLLFVGLIFALSKLK